VPICLPGPAYCSNPHTQHRLGPEHEAQVLIHQSSCAQKIRAEFTRCPWNEFQGHLAVGLLHSQNQCSEGQVSNAPNTNLETQFGELSSSVRTM
jgi:hypothetical protein